MISSEILHITPDLCKYIKDKIYNDKYQNVYLYIDVLTDGFIGNEINSFVLMYSGKPIALIYIYYSSVQLFCLEKITDRSAEDIAEFVTKMKIKRVTGRTDAIELIGKYVNGSVTGGHIMKYVGNDGTRNSQLAAESDLPEITELICSDRELGAGYTYDNLLQQLKYRMSEQGCKSRIIKAGGKIISHFATFAVSDDMAVLSGMTTHSDYRRRGFGSILVRDLSNDIMYIDNKQPILYCYQDEYYTWYQKLGYKTVGTSSKLEIIY